MTAILLLAAPALANPVRLLVRLVGVEERAVYRVLRNVHQPPTIGTRAREGFKTKPRSPEAPQLSHSTFERALADQSTHERLLKAFPEFGLRSSTNSAFLVGGGAPSEVAALDFIAATTRRSEEVLRVMNAVQAIERGKRTVVFGDDGGLWLVEEFGKKARYFRVPSSSLHVPIRNVRDLIRKGSAAAPDITPKGVKFLEGRLKVGRSGPRAIFIHKSAEESLRIAGVSLERRGIYRGPIHAHPTSIPTVAVADNEAERRVAEVLDVRIDGRKNRVLSLVDDRETEALVDSLFAKGAVLAAPKRQTASSLDARLRAQKQKNLFLVAHVEGPNLRFGELSYPISRAHSMVGADTLLFILGCNSCAAGGGGILGQVRSGPLLARLEDAFKGNTLREILGRIGTVEHPFVVDEMFVSSAERAVKMRLVNQELIGDWKWGPRVYLGRLFIAGTGGATVLILINELSLDVGDGGIVDAVAFDGGDGELSVASSPAENGASTVGGPTLSDASDEESEVDQAPAERTRESASTFFVLFAVGVGAALAFLLAFRRMENNDG